jgi:spermidine synthase
MIIYAITVFTSAFLLFQVQFIMARYVLPWFGGSSSIWTTCLLFFQVLLPLGYLYAHLLKRYCPSKAQGLVHVFLVAVSFYFLPIIPDESLKPTEFGSPVFQIIELLLRTVGIPFLLLSSTAPLIQHWFSNSFQDRSPYRLYAVSNFGSLLGLISYPVFFEQYFSITAQSQFWAYGFSLYALGCVLSAGVTTRRAVDLDLDKPTGESVCLRDRLMWLILPAIGTLMLLASTTQITKNVAAIPLVWAIPLSLYLVSFIICFDKPKWYERRIWIAALILLLAGTCFELHYSGHSSFFAQISLYSMLLFSICMVCHGELYLRKPEVNLLTSYYLHIGFGGALGSIFVAVIAPIVFYDYWEFYIGLIGSYLILATLFFTKTTAASETPSRFKSPAFLLYAVGGLGLLACIVLKVKNDQEYVISATRNFYGRLRVIDIPFVQGLTLRKIKSGSISHGTEILFGTNEYIPTTYFGPGSGVGKMFAHLYSTTLANQPLDAGFIGLGCGTLAVYGRPGDSFTFYEINPHVVEAAQEFFSYLKDSKARIEHRVGDARILLEQQRAHVGSNKFDLFVVDAFYGDTPPIHLLTHEAITLYFDHLKEGGFLALNISNLYLNMIPVMRTIAKKMDIEAFVLFDKVVGKSKYIYNDSTWMVLTKDRTLKSSQIFKAHYTRKIKEEDEILWTDDLSNVFSILK